MKKGNLKLISNYALRSDQPYAFSSCVADTTHHQFHFCKYKNVSGRDEPAKVWEGVVSTEELFKALQDAGVLKESKP